MIAAPKYWKITHISALIFGAWLLGGYEDIGFLQKTLNGSFSANKQINYPVEYNEEAPDVFRASEVAVWDGRSSLEGIWVTDPEIDIAERIIIQNGSTKKFVIGALFRRNMASPRPTLVISFEAAETLGISAGVPANLMVVALRKLSISENTLDQSGSTNGSASRKTKVSSSTHTSTRSASTASPTKVVHFELEKPFIQVGIFGVEQNAENTAEYMRHMGILPTIKIYKRNNRTFWLVLIGPASTAEEQMTLFQENKNSWI